MKTVIFTGHSNDLVHVDDATGEEEHSAITYGEEIVAASFVVGGRVRVRAIYDGCWSFSAGHLAEEIPFPDWPIRTLKEHDYSARLEIDVPDECALVVREAK